MKCALVALGFCAALLLFTSLVDAQTLQKCIGKGGAVAFRSGPCEPSETLSGQREAGRDLRTPKEWAALRERQRRESEGSRYLSRLAGTDGMSSGTTYSGSRRNEKVVRCENAKAERARVLKAYGIHATMQIHSNLNRMVYDACKS